MLLNVPLLRGGFARILCLVALPSVAAAESDRGFDVTHYELDVTVSTADSSLAGTVTMAAVATQSGLTEVNLDLRDELAVSAVVPDAAHGVAGWSQGDHQLVISLDAPLVLAAEFALTISYGGRPASVSGPVAGDPFIFHRHGSQEQGTFGPSIFTLSVAERSRAWWPCKDDLTDKATVDIAVTVRDTVINGYPLLAIANGSPTGTTTAPDGWVTYNYRHRYPIAPYLVSLAISNYAAIADSVTIETDDGEVVIPLDYYVFPEDLADAAYDFGRVDSALVFYSSLFGPYPFRNERYAMAEISSGTSMEHQTVTSLSSSVIRGNRSREPVVVHELAHQWWGDWVGLADWRDVWLNEGFTTYCEALWIEYTEGVDAYHDFVAAWDHDPPPQGEGFDGALYDPVPLYGKTPYDKGGYVLHMLRHILGDAHFLAGLRLFADRFGGTDVVVTDDFRAVCEEVSGMELGAFFDQWVYYPGRPDYRWHWGYSQVPGGYELTVGITQHQMEPEVYWMPIDLEIETAGGSDLVVVENTEREQTFTFTLGSRPLDVRIDPGNWILRPTQAPVSTVMLRSPRPNPARGKTDIAYFLAAETDVELHILDITGRRVRTLVNQQRQGQEHVVGWDGLDAGGRQAPAGVYYVLLETSGTTRSTALVLVR